MPVQRIISFPSVLALLGSAFLLGAVVPKSHGSGPLDPRADAMPHGSAEAGLTASLSCETDGAARIDAAFARWTELVRDRESLSQTDLERRAEGIIAAIFAIDGMSREILGGRWASSREHERQQFRDALVRALREVLIPYFESQEELPQLRPSAEEWAVDGTSFRARYWYR